MNLGSFGFFLCGSGCQHLDEFLGVDFVVAVDDHRFEGVVDLFGAEFVTPGHEGVSQAVTVDVAFAVVERFESVDDDVVFIRTLNIEHALVTRCPSPTI